MSLVTAEVVEGAGESLARLYYKSETGSTNDDLIVLARSGAAEKTVVVAEVQTKGRGRRGSDWHCAPGEALAFSYLADWKKVCERRLLPSLRSGLAIAMALESFGVKVGVKWPNDLLINDRKVAGILTEVSGEALVIGIGLNVSVMDFPEVLRGSATSVLKETGLAIGREELLAELIRQLEIAFLTEDSLTLSKLRERCALTGRAVALDHHGERVEGHVRGLSDEGELILFNGHTHLVINQASEIRFLDSTRSALG